MCAQGGRFVCRIWGYGYETDVDTDGRERASEGARSRRRAVGPFYLGVRPPPIGYSTFNRR